MDKICPTMSRPVTIKNAYGGYQTEMYYVSCLSNCKHYWKCKEPQKPDNENVILPKVDDDDICKMREGKP